MNRLLRIATVGLVVLVFAIKSHADIVTARGEIHSSLSILSVVDRSGNSVSKTGLVIGSDPFATFDDMSSGGGYSTAYAEADGGVDPDSLGSGDTMIITSSINFGLNGAGSSYSAAYAATSMWMSIENQTAVDVTVNFELAYQFDLSLSAWTDPETSAVVSGDLEIVRDDDSLVLFLDQALEDQSGGNFSADYAKTFEITLAAGQDATLEMTSFLGGEASTVPEPTILAFLGVLCLVFQSRNRRRTPPAIR